MGVQVNRSDGATYNSIKEAACAAGVNNWTMSVKMATAGKFVDNHGLEYTRLDGADYTDKYSNTGVCLCHPRSYASRTKSEPITVMKMVEPPVDFSITGGGDKFTMTIENISAKRLAKLIVLITKEE